MTHDKTTTAVNAAVIVIGSYHVHASVAFGALIGASLFVLSQKAERPINKAWLFAVSFVGGIFGYDGAEDIVNWLLPGDKLHINSFTAAALFSAGLVLGLQRIMRLIDQGRLKNTELEEEKEV